VHVFNFGIAFNLKPNKSFHFQLSQLITEFTLTHQNAEHITIRNGFIRCDKPRPGNCTSYLHKTGLTPRLSTTSYKIIVNARFIEQMTACGLNATANILKRTDNSVWSTTSQNMKHT